MLFDLFDKIIPAAIIFMLLRGILSILLGKKKRSQEPEEYPEDAAEYDYDEEYKEYSEHHTEAPTPADIFEQKMRDKENAKQSSEKNGIGGDIVYDGDRVLRDNDIEKDGSTVRYGNNVLTDGSIEKDGSTVRYGNTVLRDSSVEKDGSIVYGDRPILSDYKPVHVESCQIKHERDNVYREYEPEKNTIPVGYSAAAGQYSSEAEKKPRKRFKNKELVQGIILGEVLGKPRALKPYGEED